MHVLASRYSPGVPASTSMTVECVEQVFEQGSEDALKAAYEMYGSLIYTFCRRTLGADRAEDATQEVFISAWRSRGRFNPEKGSLAGWLIAIAKNRIVDNVRAEQRHAKRRSELDPGEFATESQIDVVGDRLLVTDALRWLPDRPRQVIAMHYFDGLTHHQIAEQLSVPVGTVKSDLRRGISRIRRQLETTDE